MDEFGLQAHRVRIPGVYPHIGDWDSAYSYGFC
jgi:hypothetical protein